MKLIIAEKPTLAVKIAKALKVSGREDGYFQGKDYIVTFAYGHLFHLKEVNEYLGEKKHWKDVELPFIPPAYEFELQNDKGVIKQFRVIESLIKRPDVSEIINCGDADREGQVIIDLIIQRIFKDNSIKKHVSRLWLPEQSEERILQEIASTKPNSEYIHLFNEGLARTYFDWAYGINITRLVSVKANHKFPCGRVLIPIVKVIYDRDMLIRNFRPEKYYILESNTKANGTDITLSIKSKRYSLDEKSAADNYAAELNKLVGKVKSIEKKEVKKQPPRLFSTSKLQGKLSKEEKMSFADSMPIIQKLYEAGFLTYPRTNTEYIAENEKGDIQKVISSLDIAAELEIKDSKRIFDDSKIEGHSAITITAQKPDMEKLSEDEKKVYMMVYNRFVSNFLIEPCIFNQVNMIIIVGDEEFNFKGESIVQLGYMKYEPQNVKDQLPELQEGQEFTINFAAIEKVTTCPKKISEDDLGNYLENPFRKEVQGGNEDGEDNEQETTDEDYKAILKGLEIGTQATRTGICVNAIEYQYISLKGQNYSIEPLGESLMKLLEELRIDLSKEKTVEFSMLQKSIYRGEATVDEGLQKIHAELRAIVETSKNIDTSNVFTKPEKEAKVSIGDCPRCKKPVFESEKGFYCEGFTIRADEKAPPECGFFLQKQHKFFTDKGKSITKTMAKSLLSKGKVSVTGLKPKDTSKQPYDALCIMDDTGTWINFKMEFEKK